MLEAFFFVIKKKKLKKDRYSFCLLIRTLLYELAVICDYLVTFQLIFVTVLFFYIYKLVLSTFSYE